MTMNSETLTAKKFRALMRLIDDDDPQVAAAVERELRDGGDEVVQLLENEKGNAESAVKSRIENLITKICVDKLQKEYDVLLDYVSRRDFLLERGLFMLAKPLYHDIDFARVESVLNELANELRKRISNLEDPYDVVQHVNDFFLNELGFAGNSKDYYNPDNSVIHRVLETRRGIPISLGVIYLLVGRRINLPVFGVGAPAHFLVKFVLEGKEIYVDVFNRGRIMSRKDAEEFISGMGFSFEPRFLKDSSDLEILARTCRNLARAFSAADEQPKANVLMELSIELERFISS
ncbi:MAG: transglutaminase-like domain-containing protein [Bacteroidetes bacterium]|jgi:regulator of sirC expression with transglutaminase-like and TPR domain|nr:transglutaminase-like domain-containing protein [Bacteroidota bacterium]